MVSLFHYAISSGEISVSEQAVVGRGRLTIFCLQSSYGSLTKSSISFFHSVADRLNPAPGNQDGRCFTVNPRCEEQSP